MICTDVLEHIPEPDISWILSEQFGLATKLVFGNIASFPADKLLPNGENAHCTVRPVAWWQETIAKVHAESNRRDYYYIVETKIHLKKLFGLKTKIKSRYEVVSNRSRLAETGNLKGYRSSPMRTTTAGNEAVCNQTAERAG